MKKTVIKLNKFFLTKGFIKLNNYNRERTSAVVQHILWQAEAQKLRL